MKYFRTLIEQTKFPFVNYKSISFSFSSLLVVASLGFLILWGLNFGIDFRGGILIEVRSEKVIEMETLRTSLNELNLGEVAIQKFGLETDALIRVQQQEGGEQAQNAAIKTIKTALGNGYDYRRVENVGPTVGDELKQNGLMAVCFALLAILVYIWLRFEWQFSVGAIVALAHDLFITLGVFAFIQYDFNLSTLAALLTIAGYSINDTVVVYDRIRENLRKYKKTEVKDILNLSLNETLSRTLITSLTTLLALFALYFFGGEIIRNFSFAMIFGVVIGTYSSLFIATPILLYFDLRYSRDEEVTA